jgi:cellulose binding protein with CBM2 domain
MEKGGVVDGERSERPARQDGGYVPPDLVSTQRFWAIPAAGQRPAAAAAPRGAESTLADQRVAPAQDVLDLFDKPASRPVANDAVSVPMAAAAPPRLPAPEPAPRPWPPAATSPAVAYGANRPAGAGKARPSRNMMAAAAAAAGVVVIGVGVAALWPGGGASPAASGDGTSSSSSSSAPAKTQRGGPSPTGGAAGAQAAPSGGQPLTRGRVVSYATAQREPGYFEGLLTLTNRTGAPLNGWQVSFTYPGAAIKSVWGGVLVRAGSTATIRGTAAAASIPVGGTVQVRFGAAGTPSAPRGCTLNGGTC